jgi:two-component system sensor histidine kinase RegB
MAQALRNVLRNGLDASREDGNVLLRIASGSGFVRLVVEDGGEGMSHEILARAAEPFFTTKEPGKGMGLGLFLARSVVDRAGGTLDIESEPGKGTCVALTLPDATIGRMASPASS